MTDNALEIINHADAALARASEIVDILKLRTKAKAIETIAVAEGLGEIAQKAKIFQLRAERKAGSWLSENIARGRPKSSPNGRIILKEIEISHSQSHRWQMIAKLPADRFDGWIDQRVARGHEITAGGLRSYARNFLDKNDIPEPGANSSRPFIYIGSSEALYLRPPRGVCALRGYEIECDMTSRLQGHHIINKSAARGNAELRELLVSCPDEIMAQVCSAHNVKRFADTPEARRILILQKILEFGLVHMREFINGLPWKVQPYEFTIEGILQ